MNNYIRGTKNKGILGFHFLFYLKHIKYMESKSILEVTSTYRNLYTTPVGHTIDDMAYLCPRNLLQFLFEVQHQVSGEIQGFP